MRLHAAGVPWQLSGSAALMLAGVPVRPRDVDVEVTADDAARAARALGLPPPTHQEGGGYSSLRTEGALAGVGLDLSGGLEVTGPGGTLRAAEAGTVPARGQSQPGDSPSAGTVPGLRIVRAGEALARANVAGSHERRAKALAVLDLAPAQVRAEALAYAEERARSAAR
jgi:hypothetical protein